MMHTKAVPTSAAVLVLTLFLVACSGGQPAQTACSSDAQCSSTGLCGDTGCQSAALTAATGTLTLSPATAQEDAVAGAQPAAASFTVTNQGRKGHLFVIACDGDAVPSPAEGALDAAAAQVVTVQPAAAPAGTSTVTCTVSSRWRHLAYGTFVLTLNASGTVASDFSVSALPAALTLAPAHRGYSVISVARTGGFTGRVALAVSGVPAGATARILSRELEDAFAPADDGAGGDDGVSGRLALIVDTGTAAPGSYTLSVDASSGTLLHSATVALTVSGTPVATPDFSVAMNPGSLSVVAGGAAATSTVSVVAGNAFAGEVALALSGLPAGATGTFDLATLARGSGTAVLTVLAGKAAAGSYALTVTAASGSLTHTASLALTVTSSTTPAADFTLTAAPGALTVTAGGAAATTALTVAPTNGFARDVSLTVTGAPAGATATLSAATVFGGAGSATLTVQAPTAAAGSYTLTIAANGGTSTHSTSVALTVKAAAPAPSFSLSASPASLSLAAGASGSSLVTVSPMNGFAASVSLGVSGVPSGATATFAAPTLATGSGTDSLAIKAGTAAAGTYALTVTGTGSGTSHTASISLTVTAATACTTDTWANFAQSFMTNNCVGCHSWASSVATLKSHQAASYISNGSMPPSGGLAASDKTRILQWLSCGTP